jgi:signal transduction histidine kinase
MESTPTVPWPRLATFVRQHTHDVRNHLNSLDLEAALLSELVQSGEARASVDRLRRQIREFAAEMRTLSAKFSEPGSAKSIVPANVLFLIWKDQAASLNPPPQVKWSEDVGQVRVSVDAEGLARTFRELFVNAISFGSGTPLRAEAKAEDGQVVFSLSEPKSEPVDPAGWGHSPLASTRRGGYGLGLWGVDRIVAASSGEVERHYDAKDKALVTTLRFPAQ